MATVFSYLPSCRLTTWNARRNQITVKVIFDSMKNKEHVGGP